MTPWALEAAIPQFEERVSLRPADFFAQLYLAEALRRRFPLSHAVPTTFDRARAMLVDADVGEAREELVSYVRDARASVASHRAQFLPLLRRRKTEIESGSSSAVAAADFLTLLGHTGPAGVERALEMLDRKLGAHLGEALGIFYRAEIVRGRDDRALVAALYRSASEKLCARGGANPRNECQRARWRLGQLEAAAAGDKEDDHALFVDPSGVSVLRGSSRAHPCHIEDTRHTVSR